MPTLTRNELRSRLSAFDKQWQKASRENADAEWHDAKQPGVATHGEMAADCRQSRK